MAIGCLSAFAQGYKGTIVGHVTDPGGLSVPGAVVKVTNTGTDISATTQTDQSGGYVVPELVPGNYAVQVEAKGFKTLVQRLQVEVNQTVRVDARLEVGAINQKVQVTATPGTVDTENAEIGQVISNHEIEDIPLNGRNWLSLALLTPGVVPTAAGANPYNINGSRPDHVNFLLGGMTNEENRGDNPVVDPSIDAIQEYKIQTNNFSAQYGREGGGVISVALKSGTNRFHGSLYDFLRNDALDSRGFFDKTVPNLKRNQFGAEVDGPIIRNNTFFMFSYEGERIRQDQTRVSIVPTLAERGGIFPSPILDPYTRKPFANNQIPQNMLDPVALKILQYIPAPNRAGVLNYQTSASAPSNANNFIVKVDHQFSSRDSLTGEYLRNDTPSIIPFRATPIAGFGSTRSFVNQFWSASYTRTFSPTLLNVARIGYTRSAYQELSANYGKSTSAEVGIQGAQPGYGLATISIAGYPNIGDANFDPDQWVVNEYLASDTLSKITHGHTITTGVEYEHTFRPQLNNGYLNPQIAFNGAYTRNAVADFMLGLPFASERQLGKLKSYILDNYFGAFVQDNWIVKPKLTLNLGLRYDFFQPQYEKYNHWANFFPDLGKVVVAGSPGYPRSLLKSHHLGFSPRIGFAYRPFEGGKTVIRGGYGIFYGNDLGHTAYTILGLNYPVAQNELFVATALGQISLADPFPSGGTIPGAATPSGYSYENSIPYEQQWNLTIGHQFLPNLGIQISYVGTKGTHETAVLDINQGIRSAAGTTRAYPGFSQILMEEPVANSNYNSLQISVLRRFNNGLQFRSNFTWSKALDDASFGSGARQPQNPLDLEAEYGPSEFNRARVWTSDFVYQLPFGRGHRFGASVSRPVDLVLGGWQLNGILQFADGLPFTPSVAGANQFLGQPTRPDRLRSGTVPNPTIDHWYDPTAFVPVPANEFRFGNSGRDILTGPGSVSVDTSIFKEFPMFHEGHRLQFRAEFFNVMNHANFGQPGTAINLPTAGIIGGASAGREIQFALKYLF
jgi:Carboxypeptidase regulatory-like domain/TonB dependent receptor-like, beta-barrel